MSDSPVRRPDVILAGTLAGTSSMVAVFADDGDFVIKAIGGWWSVEGIVVAQYTINVNGIGIWGNQSAGTGVLPTPQFVPNPWFVVRSGQVIRVDVIQGGLDVLSLTISGYWLVT